MTIDASINRPQPKKGIMEIAAYVPGSTKSSANNNIEKIYKLSSNETPLGAPSNALDAYRQAAGHLELYPDGEAHILRDSIASTYGLNPANIMTGNGSDELLSLLAQTYLSTGDEGIMTEHGFSVYDIQIRAAGAKVVVAKEQNCTIDIDAIIQSITDKTKIVFIANPGNPTGTYLNANQIRALHAKLPKHILLVLDSAYAEYVTQDDYEAGIELVATNENVVMTRTFSKIYGLAALRIGWMYAPLHIIDALNRIRGPFNVNTPAQQAGAAAIKDREFVKNSIAFNHKWRDWLVQELTALGLKVTPSVTNFILIHFPDNTLKSAKNADTYLKQHGFILRSVGNYGFPNALRLSIGCKEANHGVVATLKQFLK